MFSLFDVLQCPMVEIHFSITQIKCVNTTEEYKKAPNMKKVKQNNATKLNTKTFCPQRIQYGTKQFGKINDSITY